MSTPEFAVLVGAIALIGFIVWFFFGVEFGRRGETKAPLHDSTKASSTVDLSITGMTCAACVNRVDKALRRVPGVGDAAVNLLADQAAVKFDASLAQPSTMIAAVEKIGYGAALLTPDVDVKAEAAQESRMLNLRLPNRGCAYCTDRRRSNAWRHGLAGVCRRSATVTCSSRCRFR